MTKPDYGIDAPYFPLLFGALSTAALIAIVAALWEGNPRLVSLALFYFAIFFTNTASFLYTTRRGKFLEWERILDGLNLNGNETILDLGCGRGAVPTTGAVTGIDVWSGTDQSGNDKAVTLRNAALEGVADRIQIETGDMRQLPFPAETSLAIHNIPPKADRQQAITEAFRVLKPGGRLIIADIRATAEYEQTLKSLGATNIVRRRLGWRFWWGNPIASTTLLTAIR